MSRRNVHRESVRLQRSLEALTIGASRKRDQLRAETEPLVGGNMTQGIHVPVRGRAHAKMSHTLVTVGLPFKFLTRIVVDEDDVEPTVPTFTYGYELRSDADVMLSACVRDWIEDESGLIGAAKVRLSSFSPGASLNVPYNAVMHLQFTGLAAPDEGDEDEASAVPAGPATTPAPLPTSGGWEGSGV